MPKAILAFLVSLVVALPGAAMAATVSFDFRASSDPGFVSTPLERTGDGLGAEVTTSSTGEDDRLGHWLNGLGIGGSASPSEARVGLGESIIIETSQLSQIESVSGMEWSNRIQSFDLFVDGLFAQRVSFGGANGGVQTVNFDFGYDGSVFEFVGAPSASGTNPGAFLVAATFTPIPLPPAAPLLGAAVAFLWWRKRRGQTA